MKENKTKDTLNREKVAKLGRRILIISVCAFVLLVTVFACVLGTVSAIKSRNSAVKYNGVSVDTETLSFFASSYKRMFMTSLRVSGVSDVEDQPAFWNSKGEGEEKTYGELLSDGLKNYVSSIVAANYLFDMYSKLSKADKEKIENAVNSVIENSEAMGDEKEFEKLIDRYGFGIDALRKAAKMLCKASLVQDIMYGEGGSAIKNFSVPGSEELSEEYLKEYTHVKLLIINTETKTDENGNEISLNEEERAKILLDVERIRGYINAVGTHEAQMNPDMFDSYIEKYAKDGIIRRDGYYFHPDADYTKNFPKSHSAVIDKAYEMELNSYAEVRTEDGVCFIYRYDVTRGIYLSSLAEYCFTDFFSDLSDKLYAENISLYAEEVEFGEKFYEIDLVILPYNYKYIPLF